MNFQLFKLVLGKAEEPEIKLPTSAGSLKKQESFRKTSISALLTMPKPLTVWITINRFPEKSIGRSRSNLTSFQLEMSMEQQTGSKLGKEYIKAAYCHPAYLTDMQSTSRKMLG